MPYSSPSDAPSYVPAGKRDQWVAVWNSAYDKAIKDGKSKKDAETSAFAQANGVVKKESAMSFPFYTTCITEAALPMNTSHDALRGHLRTALMQAHGVSNTYDSHGPWIMDTFPTHVVYQHGGQTYKRKYNIEQQPAGTDPKVTLGDMKKVHTAYVDSSASESVQILLEYPADDIKVHERYISHDERNNMMDEDFAGKHRSFPINHPEDVQAALHSIGRAGSDNYDSATLKKNILAIAKRKGFPVPASDKKEGVMITLPEGCVLVRESVVVCEPVVTVVKEAGTSPKTTIPVCIIKPGWGSSAYYSKKMIQESGPQVFTKNTHMYLDHATDVEEALRPEGSIDRLAAVLNKNAYWDENGPKGPGLYSEALLFSDHADKILEKGPYTGCSVNVALKASEGTVDGRTGLVAQEFVKTSLNSIDFVTKAGAGGAPIVPVTESAKVEPLHKESTMTEQEKAELEALRKDLKEAKEKESQATSKVIAMEAQQNKIVAVATVGGLLREAGVNVRQSLLERVCDSPKMKEGKIDPEWAKETAEDLMGVSEAGGSVRGLGEGHLRSKESQKDTDDEDKKYRESLKIMGVPEAGLDYAMGVKN